ncbi:MAG: hypothetical protein PGN15_05280 [Aeromicrobium erythreum]
MRAARARRDPAVAGRHDRGRDRGPGRRPRAPLRRGRVGPEQLALHFHDTYGQALANVHAGLQAGVTTFDASAGGLGGCPYARSATGNLATEDLVWFLTGLGIQHGVDLDALVATSTWMAEQLGKTPASAVVRALGSS